MDGILLKLESLINSTLSKTIDLQNTYTEYIASLLDEISAPVQTDIDVSIYNGSDFRKIKVESILKNDEGEIVIKCNDGEHSWNDLNIFSMDIIINRIHIQLMTEINMYKMSNGMQ